jgi:hypothetical protein
MSQVRRVRFGTALILSLFTAGAASAQIASAPGSLPASSAEGIFGKDVTSPSEATPRQADGHPDLTGFWKGIKETGKPIGNIGRDEPGYVLPFTDAGKAAQVYLRTKTIDPEALCILGGIPRHNASALPFEILHTPHRLAFLYLYTTHRIIPIDGRRHDDDPEPAYFGNPIGSWDGDTFVIDSIGFKDSKDGKVWGDENGDPVSGQAHVVERWTRPDFDHIHLEMIVTDATYYTRPLHFARTWVRAPNRTEGLTEYACTENNIDAAHLGPGPGEIGADGNRGYATPVLPKDPPGPEAYTLNPRPVSAPAP